jgi:acyl carrier protein
MKIKKKNKKIKISIEEIIQIANNILKKYNKKITKKDLNLSLYSAGYFDSLDFVNFISALEKKFKKKFKTSDLDVNLNIKKILKLIN